MTILIVDDSQATRRLLLGFLKELGVQNVLQAPSVAVAIETLKLNPTVRLILTDWHMPGASGFDLLEQLKANPQWKSIPVVMVTSESSGENVVAALKAAEESNASISAVSWGKLRPGELGNVIQFLVQSGKSGVCELQSRGIIAEIFIDRGRITGARFQLQRGEEAFFTCFSTVMEQYRFREEEVTVPVDTIITASTNSLLLEAVRRMDHLNAASGI